MKLKQALQSRLKLSSVAAAIFVWGMTTATNAGASAPAPEAKSTAKPVAIKPGKAYEKCMLLNAVQTLEYQFDASAKVNFNLHYHKGDAIYYPLKTDRTLGETGSYESQVREEFCLMWENKTSAEVTLNYSYKVRK